VRGYTVGNIHPTLENINEETRQEESAIPIRPRFTGFKAVVRASNGGRHGLRYGTAGNGTGQATAPATAERAMPPGRRAGDPSVDG
jgi:hypothetical protein